MYVGNKDRKANKTSLIDGESMSSIAYEDVIEETKCTSVPSMFCRG